METFSDGINHYAPLRLLNFSFFCLFFSNLPFSVFSQCVPILGRGFDSGGYKCECKQGYEYPLEDLITYYDGQLVEAEFTNIVEDKLTR